MSTQDAQQILAALAGEQYDWHGSLTVSDVQVNAQTFSYRLKVHGGFGGHIEARVVASGKDGARTYQFAQMPYLDQAKIMKIEEAWCVMPGIEPHRKDFLCWREETDTKKFVVAVNRMIWENSPTAKTQKEAEERTLQQQIAAWRANGSQVALPEEAQRHFVLAQEAFRQKDFQRQAEELTTALEIYPTWPAEQFDLALVLGELNRYSEAIQHMQMYLELSPDAPDAQRAKQQIWIWQDKVKTNN
jgi:tetratricopeptide (TPR) repeat protein